MTSLCLWSLKQINTGKKLVSKNEPDHICSIKGQGEQAICPEEYLAYIQDEAKSTSLNYIPHIMAVLPPVYSKNLKKMKSAIDEKSQPARIFEKYSSLISMVKLLSKGSGINMISQVYEGSHHKYADVVKNYQNVFISKEEAIINIFKQIFISC